MATMEPLTPPQNSQALTYFIGIGNKNKDYIDATHILATDGIETYQFTVEQDILEDSKFTDTTYPLLSENLEEGPCVVPIPTLSDLNQTVFCGNGQWDSFSNQNTNNLFCCYEYENEGISHGVSLATSVPNSTVTYGQDTLGIGQGVMLNATNNSVSIGQYNDYNKEYLFAIGNGTSLDTRKNIFEVTADSINITSSAIITDFMEAEGE